MLRQSFIDDKIFAQFISLKFYDSFGIDHANVIHQLYQYYGSETFWQKAKSLNYDDKQWVENYLEYAMSENKYHNNKKAQII